MSEPNPTPAFRLGCGTVVAGFRLLRCLGRGWESTNYLAAEEAGGALRRLKFFRVGGDNDLETIEHFGRTVEALALTGALPAYHGAFTHRRGREDIPVQVYDYIDGRPLLAVLDRGRWGRAWTPAAAILALHEMAAKLAAVHRLELALGEFEDGANILLPRNGGAVWCDFDPGSSDDPNRCRDSDHDMFFTVVNRVAALRPAAPEVAAAVAALDRFRSRKATRRLFADIAAILADFLPTGRTRCPATAPFPAGDRAPRRRPGSPPPQPRPAG